MSVEVPCECGHVVAAGDETAGGIVNCPACGHAVEVPGLRDPWWRLLQAAAALAWAGGTALAWAAAGSGAALVTAVALAGCLWLLSRAL
ncbi:MAG: hypothetical protein ACE5JG_09840 [Planctomycetota bacterium]